MERDEGQREREGEGGMRREGMTSWFQLGNSMKKKWHLCVCVCATEKGRRAAAESVDALPLPPFWSSQFSRWA